MTRSPAGETMNYGRCALCGRPINRDRNGLSHYCSPVCADLVRRYGYGHKRPKSGSEPSPAR